MFMLCTTGMQILYWFENTKEPMPENQYLRRIHSIIDSIRKSYFYWGVRCGYSILKRSVKLTRFKSFPLQLSGHQNIPLLSFVRVASSTILRCGWVFISARSVENCISVERLNTLNTDLQSLLENIKKFAAG